MLANVVVETFLRGGWVMWPILGSFFLALCVVIDRVLWWLRFRSAIRVRSHQVVRDAIRSGSFPEAWNMCRDSGEPFLRNLSEGLAHANTSLLAAMQLDASRVIEQAEARMWVLSTMITLAPLLGLFGTVVGIMGSFAFVGDAQLAPGKVSGGIAEALIATSCGIAIAVLSLLPYNFFRKRLAVLRSSFERWINHTELLARSAKEHGHDIEAFAAGLREPRASRSAAPLRTAAPAAAPCQSE